MTKPMERGVVYVFGSNKSGKHESGGALHARLYKGAKYGNGFGRQGMAYAIPTKDYDMNVVLPLAEVKGFVDEFVVYAKAHPELSFYISQVGTGKAGHTPEEMAAMFVDVPDNCILSNSWRRIIKELRASKGVKEQIPLAGQGAGSSTAR